jgi:hypothetical protein
LVVHTYNQLMGYAPLSPSASPLVNDSIPPVTIVELAVVSSSLFFAAAASSAIFCCNISVNNVRASSILSPQTLGLQDHRLSISSSLPPSHSYDQNQAAPKSCNAHQLCVLTRPCKSVTNVYMYRVPFTIQASTPWLAHKEGEYLFVGLTCFLFLSHHRESVAPLK